MGVKIPVPVYIQIRNMYEGYQNYWTHQPPIYCASRYVPIRDRHFSAWNNYL